MAFLKADKTYTLGGIEICEKLITANSGVRYYSGKKLSTPDHKPTSITIHNTEDIDEARGTNDAEQYARATFNNNMKDVIVHYYIDETACWHILADDTVGYHAFAAEGNNTSIAIEIVMDGSGDASDVGAEDRGARLAAALLNKYGLGIDRLKTHRDWYPKKYCPAYILPHWDAFKRKVQYYYDSFGGEETESGTKENARIYRVQIGAFANLSNAEALAEKARKAGFEATIAVRGDVDGDGKVTAADARAALRIATGLEP